MKRCARCKEEKPLEDFTSLRASRDGKDYYCKPCANARYLEHREARLEYQRKWTVRQPGYHRRYALRRKYGMTSDDFWRLVEDQEGRCTCGRYLDFTNTCVDHCHKTGKVRGLLCTPCNLALGHTGDDPKTLMSLASYVVWHVLGLSDVRVGLPI